MFFKCPCVCVCMWVCVCVCARACVRACVCDTILRAYTALLRGTSLILRNICPGLTWSTCSTNSYPLGVTLKMAATGFAFLCVCMC